MRSPAYETAPTGDAETTTSDAEVAGGGGERADGALGDVDDC